MQVVIEISEDKIPWNLGGCTIEIGFCDGKISRVAMVDSYDEENLHFTELPKGYGRLISENYLLSILRCEEHETCTWMNCSECNREKHIKRRDVLGAPTIIEAESE